MKNLPLKFAVSTTIVASLILATMRLRVGKLCLSGFVLLLNS